MKKFFLEFNEPHITNEKKILDKYNKVLNKIFIFLDKYISKLIKNQAEFEYIKSIKLFDKEKKEKIVISGNILNFDFENKTLSIFHKKVYIPYYNEIKLVKKLKFREIGFNDLRNILIIKYLTLLRKNDTEIYGVKNFPKLVIANNQNNSKIIQSDLETVLRKLEIKDEEYSKEKYHKVIEKYNEILLDFYKNLKLDNIYYKMLCKKLMFYENSYKLYNL